MADDLSDVYSELRALKAQIRDLQRARPLENASVTNGRVRFIGGTLRVDSGGRVEIEGTLEGGGTFTWTGTLTNNGQLTQNGPWSLAGDGTITGNATVQGGGRLRVGTSLTLNPAGNNGRIEFANGSQVFTDGGTIQVFKGNSAVNVSDDYARIQYGGNTISIGNDGVRITGTGTKAAGDVPGSFPGALYVEAGTVYRIV